MIIFLNGSINAGKSTVAKLLSKAIPNSALVEIDSLREMIEWMPIDKAVPLNLENALAVIRNFTKRELNVIVPYPLSQKNCDYMMAGLKDFETEIQVFTLAPTLDMALTNRGTRVLNEQEKERIKHHYNIGIPSLRIGKIIDNSNQSPEETAKHILTMIYEV